MTILTAIAEVRRALDPIRPRATIGLVPTMGALHEGHVALFRAARRVCSPVVATIFVNPAQFGDPTDLAAYPSDPSGDAARAAEAGVDYLFMPSATEVYPPGYATWIDIGGVALGLEGNSRPGHFRGVATVCLKLFSIIQPRIAFFGQKDAQQVAVIRQLVRDLNLPIDLRVVPTVRDHDGLALSSRNALLSREERLRARALPRALEAGLAARRAGRDPVDAARQELKAVDIDYVADADLDGRRTLVVAARVGRTRLIDNVPLDEPEDGSGI
jgi:pantoate--beta-alanine ligase